MTSLMASVRNTRPAPGCKRGLLLFRPCPGPNVTLLLSCLAAGLSSTTPCTALCPWESTWPPSSGCTPPGSTGSGTISFPPDVLVTFSSIKVFFQRGRYSWFDFFFILSIPSKNTIYLHVLFHHNTSTSL